MDTAVIISIVVVALVVISIVAAVLRRRAEQRQLERERLAGQASGHRQEADAHVAKARELDHEAAQERQLQSHHAELAERHAAKADEHAERADQLEGRVPREGRSAAFHDERATEIEEKI